MVTPERWHGDIPWYLLIVPHDAEPIVVDLDEPGWLTRYADLMRIEATWHLASKTGGVAFSLIVRPGEQPYYVARHVGIASAATGERQAEVVVYGIGKKRVDGHVDRLWILPNGQVCAGDDAELFARALLTGGT